MEASALDVLQGEICRVFEQEGCEKVGQDIGFRFVTVFPLGPAPFCAPLDVLKFFCKDVWIELYGKKIDRLQTNHKGTFMCTDTSFAPLARLRRASQAEIAKFVALHRGIIRGALVNLGLNVTGITAQLLNLTAEDGVPLGCCFTVQTLAPRHPINSEVN
jgi:hypothetical protein